MTWFRLTLRPPRLTICDRHVHHPICGLVAGAALAACHHAVAGITLIGALAAHDWADRRSWIPDLIHPEAR